MAKIEGVFKTKAIRLTKRELNKVMLPLKRDVRSLKRAVSESRKTIEKLKRFAASQRKQLEQKGTELTVASEEIKNARISPRLIQTLRKRLGISQRELASLARVSIGAVHQWERRKFAPKDEKKRVLVALRKLGRREVRAFLNSKAAR